MHDDEQEARRILAWTERLYVLDEAARLAEHALLVLLDAAGARRGCALFATPDGRLSLPRGGLRLVDATRVQRAEVMAAARARLGQPVAVRRHDGPLAAALVAAEVISLRVEHRNLGCSLWLLEGATLTRSRLHTRLETLGRAIGYAGELMLPNHRDWLGDARGVRRARLDTLFPQPGADPHPPAPVDPLDGLNALSADCARLAARGYTNREIGLYLGLATSAVGRHLSASYRHLGIDGRHQLDVWRLLEHPKPSPRPHAARRPPRRRSASDEAHLTDSISE